MDDKNEKGNDGSNDKSEEKKMVVNPNITSDVRNSMHVAENQGIYESRDKSKDNANKDSKK
jgi:hypothetical protein